MIFRRKYENLFKDLQCFIEIYINGRKKIITEEKKKIEKPKEESTLLNSLLSENNNLTSIINDSSKLFNGKRIITDLKFKSIFLFKIR
jgi:hypothetical protein